MYVTQLGRRLTVKFLITLVFLAACGYESDEAKEEETKIKSHIKRPSAEERPIEEESNDPKSLNQCNFYEFCALDKNGVSIIDSYDPDVDLSVIISTVSVSYYIAKTTAPEGYKLPSRGDLIDLYDSGLFDGLHGYQGTVWTSNEVTDPGNNRTYSFNIFDGLSVLHPVDMSFICIYLKL